MRFVGRRKILAIAAAYTARVALTSVSTILLVLPRRRKVTMLTREHARPSRDFLLLRDSIRRQDPSIEVVLIARMVPPGIFRKFGYSLHLLVELYHVATSRVLVVDGYSLVASSARHGPGLTIVQLWHALGALKKFGLSILGSGEGRDPHLARATRMHRNYDLVVASAERCRLPFSEAFGIDVSKVVVAPLPRVDALRDPAAQERTRARFRELHPDLADERIALFAPTFRSGDEQPVDLLELTRTLRGIGYATIVKLHPLTLASPRPGLTTAPEFSTQDLILIADVFITDYSSAIFEAAVVGVPSYLLATDLERYSATRDFYLRYPEDLGLPLAVTIDGLVSSIAGDSAPEMRMASLAARFVEGDQASGTANADAIASLIRERARLDEPPTEAISAGAEPPGA